MVSAGRHPKSAVASALAAAKGVGLTVKEDHNGHRWGTVTCAACGEDVTVWSTPRSPDAHAKWIKRFVARHTH